jgi:1-acyl-sn-glycerol-3-phosphate acyltransferase
MAAISELSRRLNIPGDGVVAVFNAPQEYAPVADGASEPADVVQLFALDRAGLERDLPAALAALKAGGRLWVIYPGPGSVNASDLSPKHGWGVLNSAGLTAKEDVKVDADWNAMRFERGRSVPAADMLPVGRAASPVFRIVRLLALPLFRAIFRFDVRGRENIPDAAYVLIANHLGWMDAVSLLLVFPPEPRLHYLADPTSMMRNRPLWALVRAAGGVVPVDRAQRGNAVLFDHVARCLAAGGVVALFPEGDFGPREGELLPFKKGFAHFAVDAGVPVLPVGMAGMKELWLGKRLFVRIGAPIETAKRSVDEVWMDGEKAVRELFPGYEEPAGRKPLRRWLTGLF